MNDPIKNVEKFVRATNYLTAAQIYLRDNFLLQRELVASDIKPKLFGHWGTCPGINFVYAHLNLLVKKHHQSTIFVLGPGHGFPALQANLYLEGTLGKYYKEATATKEGIGYVVKQFSWPYGFSSHSNPEAPGLILEGGELGYSLATGYGAILDNPDLLAVCMIGDGEAETGPLASSWHINKLIDPATNGAVLPILHRNGYKISGPSIFGRMSDEELLALFTGYGYEPFFVRGENIYAEMVTILETCYKKIKAIQVSARKKKSVSPRFPMIILDTPKGWTTMKAFRDRKIEGTILSHQVVLPNVRGDEEELRAIEKWLQSYRFGELFDEKHGFSKDITGLLPEKDLRIGNNAHVFSGRVYKDLHLPKIETLATEVERPGMHQSNSMRMAGAFLREAFRLNEKQKNFRLMSPDETYSNRLDDVFSVTSRAFVWPHHVSDEDLSQNGRVMEMLSEHNLHGLLQGYVLTGRHGVLATYEAFAQIFSSMAHQYVKFLKVTRQTHWRGKVASLNYILSSTAWRQEHNGYSHQNPGFITGMLEKNNCFIKVYFPADENSMLASLHEALASTNSMNTIVSGKSPEPRWVSLAQAKASLEDGLSVWDFASDADPDIVLVGIGDYMTKECLAAIDMLKSEIPEMKIRFVNVVRISAKCTCVDRYHPQLPNAEKYFTDDKPVIVNFHGYPEAIKPILFDVKNPQRFSVHGYTEHGGTTTPFDMQVRNSTSRYHLAIEALTCLAKNGSLAKATSTRLIKKYQRALRDHRDYIIAYGADPLSIENWQWRHVLPHTFDADEIAKLHLLKESKTIAMVGLSDKKDRPSFQVAAYLKAKGFRVIPVNPHIAESDGEKAYPDLLSIPKEITIDIVDIFRRPEEVVAHMKEVVERGDIKNVWLQDGVESQKAEEFARDFGLTLVSNFCIRHAYERLQLFKE